MSPGADVLRALAERDLIFELMAHPDLLESAAAALADFDDLTVVVEHAGWPAPTSPRSSRSGSAASPRSAALGDNVHCKLSGLAMPLHSNEAARAAAVDRALPRAFGVDRCMFASNFPVDAMHGTFDELYGATTAPPPTSTPRPRDKLFAANAERLYRC